MATQITTGAFAETRGNRKKVQKYNFARPRRRANGGGPGPPSSPTFVGAGRRSERGRVGQLDHGRGAAGLRRRVAVAVARRPAAAAAHVIQQLAVRGPPALRYEPQPGETLAEVFGQHAVQDGVDDGVEQREQQPDDEVVRPQEEPGVLGVPAAVHVDQAHHHRDRQPHHQHHDHVDQQHAHHPHVLPVPELLVPYQHLFGTDETVCVTI